MLVIQIDCTLHPLTVRKRKKHSCEVLVLGEYHPQLGDLGWFLHETWDIVQCFRSFAHNSQLVLEPRRNGVMQGVDGGVDLIDHDEQIRVLPLDTRGSSL